MRTATITLRTASHNHGQGHETTLRADRLGRARRADREVPPAHRRAGHAPGRQPHRRLALAARHRQRRCCSPRSEIVKKGLALAAEELESGDGRHRVRRGRVPDQGHRPRGDASLRSRRSTRASSTSTSRSGPRSAPPSRTAATSPRSRSSPRPGEVEIVSYLACDDAGNIVNHQIVEGQMQGGITQGAGHVFGEQAVYDAERPAPHRQLHGLRRCRAPVLVNDLRVTRPSGADRDQSARRQGRGRGGRHGLDALPDERGDGRAAPGAACSTSTCRRARRACGAPCARHVDALERLFERARLRRPRIVLPETGDERIVEAARRLKNQGVADPILPDPEKDQEKLKRYAALYPGNPKIAAARGAPSRSSTPA